MTCENRGWLHLSVTELMLERMVHGGACLARLPDGKLALVHGGLPGETIRTELRTVSGVPQGIVTEVVTASDDRVEPTRHPGLNLDYVRYDRQLELKTDIVRDALQRALPRDAEPADVAPAVASPAEWSYRNTVQPVVFKGQLGYLKPGTAEVVLMDADPVANPAIQRAWETVLKVGLAKGVRQLVIRGVDSGEAIVALIASASARNFISYAHDLVGSGVAGVAYAEHDPRGRFRRGSERLAGTRQLRQQFGDYELSVTAGSFAQPNASAATLLYRRLRELAGTGHEAHDLYAGSGGIAFHLAAGFSNVFAFEIDRSSVERGRNDARRLELTNVTFEGGDVKQADFGRGADLVTVDPPRSGLGREVRDLIHASDAGRLIYVSCDAATWARDTADLVGKGWKLDLVEPFDFQPHTHHVELLSHLSR